MILTPSNLVAGLRSLTRPAPSAPASQTAARLALGAFMVGAGTSHLTVARQEFHGQVPDWFPVDKDVVVLVSGVAEVALGAGVLALPRFRRATGTALAAFYTAILPGNIAQYAERNNAFGLDSDAKRLVRLFGQPALIAAALWAAGYPSARD